MILYKEKSEKGFFEIKFYKISKSRHSEELFRSDGFYAGIHYSKRNTFIAKVKSFYLNDSKRSQEIKRHKTFCFYNNLIFKEYDLFKKQMKKRGFKTYHLPILTDFI